MHTQLMALFKWQINDFVILILRSLYTSLSHDLIKAKVLSLVWYFNRESNKYLGTSNKAGFFQQQEIKLITRIKVGLVLSFVKLLLSS